MTIVARSATRSLARSLLVKCHRSFRRRAIDPTSSVRVLLVAKNPMMFNVLEEVWRVVRDRYPLQVWLTMPPRFGELCREFAAQHGMRVFPNYHAASRRWWDLVLFADHAQPFDPSVTTVLMAHGFGRSSKMVGGDDYSYGERRVIRSDGTPVYSLILAQSNAEKESAFARYPQLRNHVRVVGDLRADRILEAQGRMESVRNSLGLRGDRPVVAILSTFGPDGLLERVGPELLMECHQIAAEWGIQFVVASHPNLWSKNGGRDGGWDQYLSTYSRSGVTVIEPGEDFVPYLGVADAAISDHTSVSVGFALTGRPLVFLAPPNDVIATNSPVAELMASSVQVNSLPMMWDGLSNALQGPTPSPSKSVAERYISYLGEASSQLVAALDPHLKPTSITGVR